MTFASFVPTPAELAYVAQVFNSADPDKVGIITGDAAVALFAGSDLSLETLSEIWAIADHDNDGFLARKGVAAAVRLIAWAQLGEPISESLLERSESRLRSMSRDAHTHSSQVDPYPESRA